MEDNLFDFGDRDGVGTRAKLQASAGWGWEGVGGAGVEQQANGGWRWGGVGGAGVEVQARAQQLQLSHASTMLCS